MRLSKVEEIEDEFFKNVSVPISRFYVNIDKDQKKIWTLSANTQVKKTPLVLVHGYLASMGVWRYNIDSLSESRPLYALDLLGFGRSSRAKFSSDPIEAQNQFVDSIEEWRKEMKLDKIILLGHSFGGFICASYGLKYSKNLLGLIFHDPWGKK
jgi:abhydrolase domain-containing protein 4